MSGRLTRQACAELRADLHDLGYGQAEGEIRELFGRRLYPVPEHLRALDPNVALVVGPRGSGKSELFNAFFRHDEIGGSMVRHAAKAVGLTIRPASATWRAAYPSDAAFPDNRALAQHVDSDERAKTLWYVMLVRRLAKEIDDGLKESLRPLTAPKAADLGAVLNAERNPPANPTAALDALDERLQRENRWLFVGYDELDTLGGFDWELMARLMQGLVALWSDYGRRWQRIRAKIFLRSDLFRRHAGAGDADFAKLAANRSELHWSDADIFGMLVKRIASASARLAEYCRGANIRFDHDDTLGLLPKIEKPDNAYRLLQRLAGEYMGVGRKKGYVRNWVLDHLRDGNAQLSPRTVVRLFEQAALEDWHNLALRPPRLLHPAALRQALDDVSRDHVTQAISSEWPWLEGVRERLRSQRFVPWARAEVVNLLQCEWDGSWASGENARIRPPAEHPERLVDFLVEMGIFRTRSNDRIDVPDLYLFGFDLRRKGGVSPVEVAGPYVQMDYP